VSQPRDPAATRSGRELEILHAIAVTLNRSVSLDEALHAALDRVIELLELDTGWVWLFDAESGASYLAASRSLPPGLAERPETMEGSCFCLSRYRDPTSAEASNIGMVTCSRLKELDTGTDGYLHHASIPIDGHDRRLGVMNVATRDWRELTDDELALLDTVSGLLGMAVERTLLHDESTRLGAAEERNRLAREIHDTLAQDLTAMTVQLESADLLLEGAGDRTRVREVVGCVLDQARRALADVRRSVMDLRAAPLEGRTLAEAVEALVVRARVEHGLTVTLDAVGGARPLAPRAEMALYRIAEESLANVARHAGADRVAVRLAVTPDEAVLTVRDDGCGFEVDVPREGRYGLVGMNERAALLDGTFRVSSRPDEGTEVRVRIPLGLSAPADEGAGPDGGVS